MHRTLTCLYVLAFSMLSLAAENTGKIASPDTNQEKDSQCANNACKMIVTHRCYCTACDSTPTGSECPCVPNNSGQVQRTTYQGQCVEVDASAALGYENDKKGFKFGIEISGKIKFCWYNSTPSTTVVTGPVCTP